ncbi:RNA polymerase sigma-70 factor [Bacteroidales bacterium OttesenSCG-928-B11]|nr:RNA polymerase sigma-70 factor [Bacteroidales bacterium OttesenSCG-928-B11]MDL2325916.1 RNA polymerase sigma-70 factor [Bacteroidales bacterium OttesenSCG-928-A14]
MEKLKAIEGLQVGDYKTFENLFVTWHKPLYLYAYSMVQNAEDAEDIVQKMFCKLWDQAGKIEIHTSMKSYLYRFVHNECLNRIKNRQIKEGAHQQLGYIQGDSCNSTEQQFAARELSEQIELAIEALPPRCREVFKLSRYEYLSHREISQRLNITTNTVETQIVKALRMLRVSLKDYLMLLIVLLFDK